MPDGLSWHHSGRFQGFIFGVIVFNAIVLGLETHGGIDAEVGGLLGAQRRLPRHLRGRARDPHHRGLRQNATLLRLVRLLRIVRIISVLPDVRVLLRGMVRSLPPIASMGVLAVLLIYLYGMVGWILFHTEDPERWGNIGDAMLTLEQWPTYLRAGMEIHPSSWIYFVSYVLIAGFLLINILIGIVINAMEGARREELAELVQALRDTIDDLEDRLGGDGAAPAPRKARSEP